MEQEQQIQNRGKASFALRPSPFAQNLLSGDFLRWLMLPLAILPLRVMYLFSDLVYYVVYYVARYRRKLVKRNLDKAFPDKTKGEKKKMAKSFYHHFCDYFFETVKLLHLSDEEMRQRFHSVGFAKNDIYREIIKMRRAGQNWLLGFISDQKPSKNSVHYWTTFLHQDTPVIIGAERIAKQTNAVVCYLDIVQVKRGYYEGTVILIADQPLDTPEYEITKEYMRLSEQTILRNPALWLWTHNRWKYKREKPT